MAILTQRKILNVIPGTAAQLTVHCSQSDEGSTVEFELYAGSVPFEPDGTASVQGVRKDGTGFGPEAVALDGSTATVTLSTAMTGAAGPALCEITITETGGSVSTANFALLVEEAAFPNGPLIENSVDVYQQILQYVQSFPASAAADATAKVAAEAALRQAADQALQASIAAEATARAAADTQLQTEISGLQNAVGGPNAAATVAAMTDTSKVYVYTGSETGYTAGNWYYWNGSAWVSGGVYNSTAVQTDPTLSVPGMAADAAACGDLKSALNSYEDVEELSPLLDLAGYINCNVYSVQLSKDSDDNYTIFPTVENANYSCYKVAVSAGDIFTLTCAASGNGPRAWAWFTEADANGLATRISVAPSGATFENYVLLPPPNAKWLVCNADRLSANSEGFRLYKGCTAKNLFSEYTEKIANYIYPMCEYTYLNTSGATVDFNSMASNDTRYAVAVISCSAGDVFTVTGVGGNAPRLWAFADSSGNILSVADAGAIAKEMRLTAPINSAYLIVNVNRTNADGFVCSGALPGRTQIHVGSGGDYTKFTDGLKAAMNSGNADLYVEAGTYDVISELGQANIETAVMSGYKGPAIGHDVNVYFSPGAKIVCNYTGSNTSVMSNFSVLNAIGDTESAEVNRDFKIFGGTFEGSNIRYLIHDECDGVGAYVHEYHDCIMTLDNSGNTGWDSRQCIGGGFGEYADIKIDGGVYNSIGAGPSASWHAAISYHQPNTGKGSNFLNKLVVRDVYFVDGTALIIPLGDSVKITPFICSGISAKELPYISGASGSTLYENVQMFAWNNTLRNG